jgi:ADP-ribosylglycohydrolase/histidinol phosphatase-like PHP family hydrolase
MKKMIDLHMHIIPDVDDGSVSIEMSEQMLRMAIEQGIEIVFATSHSLAHEEDTEYTRHQFRKLQKMIKEKELPIKVYLGCEVFYDIRCIDRILKDLDNGRLPSLNGTKYVLTELFYGLGKDTTYYINILIEKGWIPIIAHAERLDDLSIETIKELRGAGCKIQINAYSIAEEKNEKTRNRALTLLDNKIVDFVGSDAHRIDHRPPAVAKGIEYLYANYDEEYVDNILYNNAMDLILCEAENEEDVESNIWIDGVMGVITGDALGMPVQFLSREDVQDGPIITMDGYGTYGMPAGTWSDDGSMTIATLDSIRERSGIDYDDIMCRFIGWTSKGEYTPAGIAFDQGNSCMEAIGNYAVSQDYRTCGKTGEWANGNGALMRIMPVCLYSYVQYKKGKVTLEEAVEYVHQVSALTHNHLRSKIACGIYFFMVQSILDNSGILTDRLQKGMDEAKKFYKSDITNLVEWSRFGRMFNLSEFADVPEDEIKSSGYVVDSLEAAVWSLITTETFEECLLRAVNLGDDTDTIGAIAGGLAGLFYGYNNIPVSWRKNVIKKEELIALCEWVEEEFYVG